MQKGYAIMEISDTERKIRSALPFTRFITAYLPVSIAQWVIEKTASRAKLPVDIRRETVTADGVPCEWLIPDNSPPNKVLLYLHGGGFIYGVTSIHLEMVAYLAKQSGLRVLMVDYRLAPKYPFPAALDDCVTAYRWLLKQDFSPSDIAIAGDSAGGNLTLTTLMKLRDKGDTLPAAAVCLSPVGDLTNKQTAFKEDYDAVLHPKATKFMNQSYIANNNAHDPLISPILGNWHDLPPLLIHAGAEEILRDDAMRIEELATEAGIDIRVEVYPRMWHVWQLHLNLPEATQSLDNIAQFLKEHLMV